MISSIFGLWDTFTEKHEKLKVLADLQSYTWEFLTTISCLEKHAVQVPERQQTKC